MDADHGNSFQGWSNAIRVTEFVANSQALAIKTKRPVHVATSQAHIPEAEEGMCHVDFTMDLFKSSEQFFIKSLCRCILLVRHCKVCQALLCTCFVEFISPVLCGGCHLLINGSSLFD